MGLGCSWGVVVGNGFGWVGLGWLGLVVSWCLFWGGSWLGWFWGEAFPGLGWGDLGRIRLGYFCWGGFGWIGLGGWAGVFFLGGGLLGMVLGGLGWGIRQGCFCWDGFRGWSWEALAGLPQRKHLGPIPPKPLPKATWPNPPTTSQKYSRKPPRHNPPKAVPLGLAPFGTDDLWSGALYV